MYAERLVVMCCIVPPSASWSLLVGTFSFLALNSFLVFLFFFSFKKVICFLLARTLATLEFLTVISFVVFITFSCFTSAIYSLVSK